MTDQTQILNTISRLAQLFEDASTFLKNNEKQSISNYYRKLEEAKKISEELDSFNFDIILINLLNIGVKKEILNNLIVKINKYDESFFNTKTILINPSPSQYFRSIPEFLEIEKKIKICENDIDEIEMNISQLPDFEKHKLLQEFKKELEELKTQKALIETENAWIKTNYFLEVADIGNKYLEKIENYFDIKIQLPKHELFQDDVIKSFYEHFSEKMLFKNKPQVSISDFKAILNMKEPKNDCSQSVKVTEFAKLFYVLSGEVTRKGYDKTKWEQFVASQFQIKETTLKSRFHKTDDTEEYKKLLTVNKL